MDAIKSNLSASEMTYIVSSGALNSTHSLIWMFRTYIQFQSMTYLVSNRTRKLCATNYSNADL